MARAALLGQKYCFLYLGEHMFVKSSNLLVGMLVPKEGNWFPLTGVKSGQVLLSADLLDELGNNHYVWRCPCTNQ